MWECEPDEDPKRKHRWPHDEAGFAEPNERYFVGKCPRTLTLVEAKEMLNRGVPWTPASWRRDYPKRIYAVRRGVVYRAMPTNPGRSYHGFPEHYSGFPTGGNAREVKDKLLEWASDEGCEGPVREWMNW